MQREKFQAEVKKLEEQNLERTPCWKWTGNGEGRGHRTLCKSR